MKRLAIALLGTLAFTACEAAEEVAVQPSKAEAENKPETFTVARVIDGDTLDLENGERIRLVQIDAPEAKGECYGKKAGKVLRQILPARTEVRLENLERTTGIEPATLSLGS
jgi:endonuclease YncB( thermonuclease family)